MTRRKRSMRSMRKRSTRSMRSTRGGVRVKSKGRSFTQKYKKLRAKKLKHGHQYVSLEPQRQYIRFPSARAAKRFTKHPYNHPSAAYAAAEMHAKKEAKQASLISGPNAPNQMSFAEQVKIVEEAQAAHAAHSAQQMNSLVSALGKTSIAASSKHPPYTMSRSHKPSYTRSK